MFKDKKTNISMGKGTERVIIEYVWCDSQGGFRNKTMVIRLESIINSNTNAFANMSDASWIPEWYSEPTDMQHLYCKEGYHKKLIPIYWCYDPFRSNYVHNKTKCIIALCSQTDTILMREKVKAVMRKSNYDNKILAIKQSYTFFTGSGQRSTVLGYIGPQPDVSRYYSNMGKPHGRDYVEQHLQYCIIAGLSICGMNASYGLSQWEYRIGPCKGINVADEITISKYIMERIVGDNQGLKIIWGDSESNQGGCRLIYESEIPTRVDNWRHPQDEERIRNMHIYNSINKLAIPMQNSKLSSNYFKTPYEIFMNMVE